MPSDPNDPALTLASLAARCDRQAAAIRDLRARVKTLEGASTSTDPEVPPADPGGWTNRTNCMVCSRAKEAGRTELTCKTCGRERNAVLYLKQGDRSILLTSTCGACGEAKKVNTAILCVPCSEAFKQWKASLPK